jgi:hypothetical protein
LVDNGLKMVTVVESPSGSSVMARRISDKAAILGQGYVRMVSVSNYFKELYVTPYDTNVIMFDAARDDFSRVFDIAARSNVMKCMILLQTTWTESQQNTIRKYLDSAKKNSFFYMAVPTASSLTSVNSTTDNSTTDRSTKTNSTKRQLDQTTTRPKDNDRLTWYQIITLKSGYAINMVKFRPKRLQVDQQYFDLKGLRIRSTSLSWSPFLTMTDCDENGKNCKSIGYLIDYTNLVAKQFNFTYDSNSDISGDWGVLPKGGGNGINATWAGVMGNVITGEYDFSLCTWEWTFERFDLMSMTPVLTGGAVLALTPKNPEIDLGLFIRPFTKESWGAIGLMIIAALICILLPYIAISYVESTTGHQMMVMVTWFFFVLLNAFYGGALTMFFTSVVNIPFENIRDVMRAYPSWKLMMQAGNEVLYVSQAQSGDPDYKPFWDRVQSNPSETVINSLQQGLDIIRTEQVVIHVTEGMLKGYLKENPHMNQPLKVFGGMKKKYTALIFKFNSPLGPLFTSASISIRESGAEDHIAKVWQGGAINPNMEVDKMVLTGGQVILVYVVITIAFMASLLALMVELCIRTLGTEKSRCRLKMSLRKWIGPEASRKQQQWD